MGCNDLPKGWSQATLEQFTQIVLGQSPPSSSYNTIKDGLPFYQGKSEFGVLYPTPKVWCNAPTKIAEKDDVLISVRAPVGPTNICPSKSCIGRGLAAIRPFCNISSRLILYLVRGYEQKLASKATGTTFKAINGNQLKSFIVPLPPLNEQKRIVAKIEELLTKLDVGVAALKKVRAELKRYRQAVLKAAFEGTLTADWRKANKDKLEPAATLLERIAKERQKTTKGKNKPLPPLDTANLPALPEGWEWATVAQLGSLGEQAVLTGPFGSTLGRSDFVSQGTPLLTIGCLTEQGISLDKAFYITSEKAKRLGRYKVQEGDLLFSRSASVGRVGYVIKTLEGSIINYHLMRLRLDSQAIYPEIFVYYVRGAKAVHDYLKQVNHGATRDGINTTNLLGMPVALPSRNEQRAVLSEIERCFSVVEKIEQTIERSLKEADRLRQSILKKAFEGKLVGQDPTEEPAEKLLEWIKLRGKP